MNIVSTKTFQLAINSEVNPDSKKLALVLPGKLDTKDYAHMKSHVHYLSGLGYFAVSFDPPGTWESPGDISLYTMTNYLKAINELIEHYGNKPTFVMGHSRGGSMAMLAGITNPHIEKFAAVMSYYSFKPEIHGEYPNQEWKTKGYHLSKREIPGAEFSDERKEFKLPYSFLEDQIQYDMEEGLRKSKKPKLFFFGTKDILVKPEVVNHAYSIASEPKKLHTLNTGHRYRHDEALIEEVNTTVGDFLKNY